MQTGPGHSGTAVLAPEEPLAASAQAPNALSNDASVSARICRHPVATAFAFGLVGLALLLFGIKWPPMMFYDEGYFVPEAKVFILGPNPVSHPQQEKPPLGKMLLSLGLRAAGDNPLGWRVAAAVCGAFALVAI